MSAAALALAGLALLVSPSAPVPPAVWQPRPLVERASYAAPIVSTPAALPAARPAARPRRSGGWIAEDKWMHFFASAFATSVAGSAARAAGLEPERSLRVGVAAGAVAGVAKEIYDVARGIPPSASFGDLVWDAGGIAAGAAVLRQTS